MKCGCIVLNYRTAEQTKRNVDIVVKQNSDVFVVIVDNLSPENDYQILLEYYANSNRVDVVLAPENGGYSKGNNFGIRYLLHKFPDIEYVAIMNPDVRCDEKHLFLNLIDKLKEDANMVLIAPLMVEKNRVNLVKIGWGLPSFRELMFSKMYLMRRIVKYEDHKYVPISEFGILKYDTVQGSFFIIKKKEFEKIGYFDDNVFMYSEENILGARIKKQNPSWYAGVDIAHYYIHERDYNRKTVQQRRKTIRQQFESENYFLKNYSNMGIVKRTLIRIVGFFFLNVEIPLGDFLRKICKDE